jgi:hypothetical protein
MISVCDHSFLNCVLLISACILQSVAVQEQFESPSFALHEPANGTSHLKSLFPV